MHQFNYVLITKVNNLLNFSSTLNHLIEVGFDIYNQTQPELYKLSVFPQNSNVENLPPHVLRLVYKEVSALAADPPEGIKIYPSEEDITELHTAIEGPGESLYIHKCFKNILHSCTCHNTQNNNISNIFAVNVDFTSQAYIFGY